MSQTPPNTAPDTARPGAEPPANPLRRVLVATLAGTTIEYYDFYIYGTAAVLVFPRLFFPAGDETAALLASLAVFGAGMVARPLGALFFGHLGDRRGRKAPLAAALLTMGFATFLIGLLPTYATAGWIAPLLLTLLRLAQGFAIGGEWSGAVTVATENAAPGRRALFGVFPQLGAPIGFILANGVFLTVAALLPSDDPSQPSGAFLGWGWRIPFLVAGALALIGVWVRLRLLESHAFTGAATAGRLRPLPFATAFREHGRAILTGTGAMFATTVLFFAMTTFSLSYGRAPVGAAPPGLGYDYGSFVLMLIAGSVVFALTTLASGIVADRFGRRPTLITVTLAIAVFGLSWTPFLGAGFPGVMLWLVLGFALMGFTFGPMGAFLPELFPVAVRQSGAGIAYNIASMLGASTAPFVTVALWRLGAGSPVWTGVYLTAAALVSLAALLAARESREVDILV
ncbi:MAG: MFS transporter [Rhodovulum sulfidophilum]|uniref:MFS transporter n=1 Tax=Rhodovulum sulfidophilum TaxID=35806 RepID=A0A2W5QF31_RHOSU|nr:MAG: MFS transporter [Rhodovulum sulfidophilum]